MNDGGWKHAAPCDATRTVCELAWSRLHHVASPIPWALQKKRHSFSMERERPPIALVSAAPLHAETSKSTNDTPMKMNLRSLLMRLALACGLGVIAPSGPAQNHTGTHYIYNGQIVALQASTTEVLVKPAAPAQATTQAMSTALALPQSGVTAVAPLTIAGCADQGMGDS